MTFFGWRLVNTGFSVTCWEKKDAFHEPCRLRRCVCWCHSDEAKDFLTQRTITPTPLACYQCGLLYGGPGWCDVVVNDDVWTAISPTGDLGGILCFNCIATRLDDLGMTDVRMLVKSGPFAHDPRAKS